MVDEYIKRHDALLCFCGWCGVCQSNKCNPEKCDDIMANLLTKLPPADVQEIRHGEWLEKETFHDENADVISEWQSARCSVCNRYHTTPFSYYFTDYDFCPNCGADMRGKT